MLKNDLQTFETFWFWSKDVSISITFYYYNIRLKPPEWTLPIQTLCFTQAQMCRSLLSPKADAKAKATAAPANLAPPKASSKASTPSRSATPSSPRAKASSPKAPAAPTAPPSPRSALAKAAAAAANAPKAKPSGWGSWIQTVGQRNGCVEFLFVVVDVQTANARHRFHDLAAALYNLRENDPYLLFHMVRLTVKGWLPQLRTVKKAPLFDCKPLTWCLYNARSKLLGCMSSPV